MPTHAELSGKLLNDASTFFKNLAEQNEDLKAQMTENAGIFEKVAVLVVEDPSGSLNDTSHAVLAGQLLADAANFFRTVGEQNEPIKEQMDQNANVYDQLSQMVQQDPLGVMPED